MRREGKAGPFIPSEVRAHTGLARATTSAVTRRRRRVTTAVGARAKASPHERRRLLPGGNACARERTHAPVRRQVPCRRGFFTNTPNFSAQTTTSTPGWQCLHQDENACTRATTSTPMRRRVPRGRGVFSQTPQTSALERRRLRPGDNTYVRATTPTSGRRRPHSRNDVLILVFKCSHFFVLWQSKQNFSIISF